MAAPYPAPGDCASRVSRDPGEGPRPRWDCARAPGGLSGEPSPTAPPGHGAGLPGQRPRKGHTHSPCAPESCLPLAFPFLPATLQWAEAGSEGRTAPTAPSTSAQAETAGRLLVPRVPCPLLGDRAQAAPGPTAARDQGAELGHGRAKRDVRAFPCGQGNSPGSCTPPQGGMLPFGLASHTKINHLHIGQTSKNVDWEVLRALMRGKLMSPAALGKQEELCRRQKTCNTCTKEPGAETCKHPGQPRARHRAPDFRQNL